MKRTLAVAVAFAMVLAAGSAYAGQRGNSGPKGKTSGPAMKAGGAPKVQAAGPKAQGGPKATSGPKTQGGPKVKSTTGGPKARTSGATAVAGNTKGPKATRTTTARSTTGSTGGTLVLTPVQQKLQRNTNLAAKLEGRLPKGTDLMLAAEGFRNLGQFVAAVNVSNNLGIPFADLKTRMVDDGLSLGQAIKAERPTIDATAEVRRAETDADRLIVTTETTPTSPTQKKIKGQR